MDIPTEIRRLKKEKNAVILAHNYQLPEVQDIADYNGDSLGLSVEAGKTDASIIVFCGVWFMAETAKVISPGKKVLIPDAGAGCPMADMLSVEQLRRLKAEHPGAKVVCYVNSSLAVKAESDLCCTSANAVEVIRRAFRPEDEIIFVPDKNLAAYAARELGRDFIVHEGFCPTHNKIQAGHIAAARELHPGAEVLVHPECTLEAIDAADHALSTGQMSDYVRGSSEKEFIIGTEEGMVYRLAKDNPGKTFYPLLPGAMICPNMKKTTLQKIYAALRDERPEVLVDAEQAQRAARAIQAMLDLGAKKEKDHD
jgi:quinolinate synthase